LKVTVILIFSNLFLFLLIVFIFNFFNHYKNIFVFFLLLLIVKGMKIFFFFSSSYSFLQEVPHENRLTNLIEEFNKFDIFSGVQKKLNVKILWLYDCIE